MTQDKRPQFASGFVVKEKELHETVRELRSLSNIIPNRPPVAQRRPRLSVPDEGSFLL